MRATYYSYVVVLAYLGVSYTDEVYINTRNCPSIYLLHTNDSEVVDGQPVAHEIAWLMATCTIDGSPDEFRTSKLNIDQCFSNVDGQLTANTEDAEMQNPFSHTCDYVGISGAGKEYTNYTIHINNGTIGCFGYTGVEVPYDCTANPMLFPPRATKEITQNFTITTTNNITSTFTVFSTAVSTAFNTSVTTAVTTAISSFPSPTMVTVTSGHKVTKTKIKTTKLTETTQVTYVVTKVVTVTPVGNIGASLYTTVVADLTTAPAHGP
ncbi:hypothetical protein F5Y04DRAFT_275890 [Hypomontagnella monticulosa]|nr:hypothetical protein F5Y04DRAFT_275890 [Hypomontagnella monticulosa]